MSESVRIADVRIGRRYRRDMGDLSGLADSIILPGGSTTPAAPVVARQRRAA